MTSLSPSISSDRTADISTWRSLGAWFLFSLVLLMCISIDSPIHYMHPRCDTAWFFVCGRAWMDGLIPYVDFADSKGPLLWFIYGLGSLISPRSFLGMYFIEVILYTFTFFTLYLTGLKLGFCKKASVSITALMALAFFLPVYHTEIKSEGLAQIFFALTLYGLASCIREGIRPWPLIAMGISFGATLLMKYSMAPMVLIPFGILFLANLRNGHNILKMTVLYLIGGGFGRHSVCHRTIPSGSLGQLYPGIFYKHISDGRPFRRAWQTACHTPFSEEHPPESPTGDSCHHVFGRPRIVPVSEPPLRHCHVGVACRHSHYIGDEPR